VKVERMQKMRNWGLYNKDLLLGVRAAPITTPLKLLANAGEENKERRR
jgi:hypothetical protein